ncbi:MAG: DUF7467 domain-containing protein [Nitrosopumilaceae archaeon]
MTNKKQLITALTLATILLAGAFNLIPLAYSTGWNHDDDDDDDDKKFKICHIPQGNPGNAHTITISKSAWEAHKEHGDYKGKCENDDHDNGEDCKCKKPSIFTVKYNGPAPVTIEIYKKTGDIGNKPPLLTILEIMNGNSVVVNSNMFGKETLEANTIYRVIQGTTQIAVVSIHTSCSQPLFIGNIYSDPGNLVTLTVESGTNSEGKQSIFLEHDPICEGATLTVTKILDPPEDPGKFLLLIDSVDKSGPVGNGETTGPEVLMPGLHTVDESAVSGTILTDYTRTIGGDCNADGSINLEAGDDAECVITNVKIQPATITLKKVVTEDNTNHDDEVGTGVFDFSIKNIEGGDPIPITMYNQVVPPGTYTLIEDGPDNFEFVMITGDDGCPIMLDDNDEELDEFTLDSGEHLTCVVLNDDDADASSGGEGIIFQHNSMQVQLSDNSLLDSCDKTTDPAQKDPCIEVISASNGQIGIVDSKLTSDTTIVLFSVVEANRLETTLGAENPVCTISAIVQHDKESFYLRDSMDLSFPANPTMHNVVALKCIGMVIGPIMDPETGEEYFPIYNVNYALIDPAV